MNQSTFATSNDPQTIEKLKRSEIASSVQKSQELHDFLKLLDDYKPTIPEYVTKYYVNKSGLNCDDDQRILTLTSLAADRFLVETIHEAKEQALLRRKNSKLNKRKSEASIDTLEICDLEAGLSQQKIYWRKSKNFCS